MTHLRIEPLPAIDWHLAEHVTVPRRSCLGLPRKYGPPELDADPDTTDPNIWRETPHQPHPHYLGVYLESRSPRRFYYRVLLPEGRDITGYGFASPAQCARAYDRVCREYGIHLDALNFPGVGNPTEEGA